MYRIDPSLNAAYIAWRNNFGGVTTTDICGNATMSFTEGAGLRPVAPT